MSTPYRVVDDVIEYTTKAGIELHLNLDFPAGLLQEAMDGDKSEEEQFDVVAPIFGDNFQNAYKEMGALERTRLIRTFFVEFEKAAGLLLGESLSSSDS